jgi:curli biogenesis system outer membrane secretion channel CsgG
MKLHSSPFVFLFSLRFFSVAFALILISFNGIGQQVTIPESVKRKCANVPFKDKTRLAVATFKMSAKSNHGNVGNLSKMLSNAMFEIECFRMMDMIEDLDKYDKYKSNSSYNAPTAKNPARPKIVPQLIITGDITEYYHTTEEIQIKVPIPTKGGGNLGSRIKNEAHIGFVMQIIHPDTREILFSKSFNQAVSKQSLKSASYNATQNINAIYQDAMEKGILDAVTYIVNNRDRIYEEAGILNEDDGAAIKGGGGTYTLEVLGGASFTAIRNIENILSGDKRVSKVSKQYTTSKGTFQVTMSGSVDELAAILESKLKSVKYEVTGFEDTLLTIKVL